MRQEIIHAAQDIIQHGGVDGLSMRSIARLVNTSPANLYEYFLNKEEIVLSVYNEVLHSIYEHLHQFEQTNDARADLLRLSMAYIDFIIQDPSQIQIVSQALQTEGIARQRRAAEDQVLTGPTADVANHSNPKPNPAQRAQMQENEPDNVHPFSAIALDLNSASGIYELFLHATDRCMTEGALKNSTEMTKREIAHVIWALTHGLVTLSLQDISTVNHKNIQTALDSFLAGLA